MEQPIMEQIQTYPMGTSVVHTQRSVVHRDKYRERFDIPNHPLWEEMELVPRLPMGSFDSPQKIHQPGRGHASRWASSPTLQPRVRFNGESPPRWSLQELKERYAPQSPHAGCKRKYDLVDQSFSPESVMAEHGSSLSLASDTSYMMEYDTPDSPPSPPWTSSSS